MSNNNEEIEYQKIIQVYYRKYESVRNSKLSREKRERE